MTKIAVTIPDEQMRTLERLRRRQGVPRSRMVQRALSVYFAQAGLSEQVPVFYEDEVIGVARPRATTDRANTSTAAAGR